MPELPEVEVVRRGLIEHAVGRRISDVSVLSDRAVRRHLAGRADFQAAVAGHRILDVRRRGKYLWFVLDNDDALLAHLGMSGQFRVGAAAASGAGGPLESAGSAQDGVSAQDGGSAQDGVSGPASSSANHPHLRVRLSFTDGGPDLHFLDQRTFGGMSFLPGQAELPGPIAHIALDPLDPAYDPELAAGRIRAKKTEIKRALLDQTVVSGIGNIYADEALWRAELHYARPTPTLTRPVVRRVLAAATAVMQQALEVGGTSFDALYVNVNGDSGFFDRSLAAYGREGLPCPRCGAEIRRAAFMNRSSFYCPSCQPKPRVRR